MNILVIGGGGREHAIVRKLKENPKVETIYCIPGNGGIAADAVCVAEIGAKDIPAQVAFAKAHDIGFAVVAPDDPWYWARWTRWKPREYHASAPRQMRQ